MPSPSSATLTARSAGRPKPRGYYERAIALREPLVRKNPTNLEQRLLVWSARCGGAGWPASISATPPAPPPICGGGHLASLCDRAAAAVDGCDILFETACCHATLAGLAGRAGSGVSAAEGEQEAAKAMECLGRAVANGYRNANEFRIESALDPLRNRPDFKKLMAELEKNSPAAAREEVNVERYQVRSGRQ